MDNDVEASVERRGRGYLSMCKDCLGNRVSVVWKRGKANKLQAANEERKNTSTGWASGQCRRKVKHTYGF